MFHSRQGVSVWLVAVPCSRRAASLINQPLGPPGHHREQGGLGWAEGLKGAASPSPPVASVVLPNHISLVFPRQSASARDRIQNRMFSV